jgi:hypothetical protein
VDGMSRHACDLALRRYRAPGSCLGWSQWSQLALTVTKGLIDLCYILTSEKHRRLSRKFVETPVENS